MKYDFLGIDEGKQILFRGNTTGKIQWSVELSEFPTARAMQRLNNKEALIGYDRGYFVVDVDTGSITHRCDRWTNVSSAQRLTDGTTLITGINLGNEKGIWVVTLDASDKVIHSVVRSGNYVRLLEPTDSGSYLLCTNRKITETNKNLKTIREFKAWGFKHAWKAVRMKDGTTLISAGYGGFMTRFTKDGTLLQKFGQTGTVPAEVKPFFYANFHFTHDGNILVANWQGHGPKQGHKGRQLICFGEDGTYKGSWSFPGVSSLQGLLVL